MKKLLFEKDFDTEFRRQAAQTFCRVAANTWFGK
jgi:hypothetical protein